MVNDNNNLMSDSRRSFIRGFSLMVGGVAATSLLSANAISVAMAYSPNNGSVLTDGKVFTKAQLQRLKIICSIVIPKTETLGAAEVDTHGFIDNQLYHCYEKKEQTKIINLLNFIEQTAKELSSGSFMDLSSDKQFSLLTDLDFGKNTFDQTSRNDFKSLKELICFGYYTSEIGATKELRYDPVPGEFKGSIPYIKSDASWATHGLFN